MKKILLILLLSLFSFTYSSSSSDYLYILRAITIEASEFCLTDPTITDIFKKDIDQVKIHSILNDPNNYSLSVAVEKLTKPEREYLATCVFKYLVDNPDYHFINFIDAITVILIDEEYSDFVDVLQDNKEIKYPYYLLSELVKFKDMIPENLKRLIEKIGKFKLYLSVRRSMNI